MPVPLHNPAPRPWFAGYAEAILPPSAREEDWIATPQSSWVLRFRWMGAGVLLVGFKDKLGVPTITAKYEVRYDVYLKMVAAASKGGAVHQHLYHLPYVEV